MNKKFNFLYQYLKRERLFVDIFEFELQIQAHPSYPSLLSITDTLSFFNIESGAFQIELSEIESLPDRFVAMLGSTFFFIEKKKDIYICCNEDSIIKISKIELESRWQGIIILVENSQIEEAIKSKKKIFFWIPPLLISVFITVIISLSENNVKTKLFFLLPIIGFIFSIAVIYQLLTKQKELRRLQSKSNQIIYNYQIFKNTLLFSTTIQDNLSQSAAIQLGNKSASLKIIILINPFSYSCEKTHSIMEEILQKHSDILCVEIRFNFNNNDYNSKKSKRIHQHLVNLYLDENQEVFMKGLHNWFKNKDENELYTKQISPENKLKINEILNAQFNSNLENNLIFAPQIIINQYLFPRQYDRKMLIHFINELSEDEDLLIKQ